MTNQTPYPDLVALNAKASELSHLKKNIVMTYGVHGGLDNPVEKTQVEIAKIIGIPASHLSRARQQLESDGWLEYTHREGQVKFYRLGERATGRRVVVPMRRTG